MLYLGVNSVLGNDRFSDALYIIDIGQNDLADSFTKGLSYVQVFNKIPSVLAEIENAVRVSSLFISLTVKKNCDPWQISQSFPNI